jgi:RNA polymerase sigma factor (sigma-70 family)
MGYEEICVNRRRSNGRVPELAKLCRFELLSADEERQLFSRLKAARIKEPRWRRSLLSSEAVTIRNRIVKCNLRLVVSLAKRFASPKRSVDDLVSEASLTLIRSVESFDVARGTRFSTYATRALVNYFHSLRLRDRRHAVCALTDAAEATSSADALDRLINSEELQRLRSRLARLPRRERMLVSGRFGLSQRGVVDRQPRTFRELGMMHGLSKERVRVITSEALDRLRQAFNE